MTKSKKETLQEDMVKDALAFTARIERHLEPCGDDLILLTLRGHLIAEELLGTILARALGLPELPKELRLGFPQRHRLVSELCAKRLGLNGDPLLKMVEKLNGLRNTFAHQLKDDAEVEHHVQEFLKEYSRQKRGRVALKTPPLPQAFKECLMQICGFLYRVRFRSYKLAGEE
jgi:hypothetical protein